MLAALEALIEKQQSIYLNAFQQPMAQSELRLTGADRPAESGLLIALKYPHELAELFAQSSAAVADTIPAIQFDAATLYTTLMVGPRLHQLSDDEAAALTLKTQRWFFDQALPVGREWRKQLRIRFTEWLFNTNTLIAASEANREYWELASRLQASAEAAGVPATLPWGSHVSVSRFLANQLPSHPLRPLVQQLPDLPDHDITPIGMELIRFECDCDGFRLVDTELWSS